MKIADGGDKITVELSQGEFQSGVGGQLRVLLEAFEIHVSRQKKYGDNWKRKGWRGALFGARLALERAWDGLWSAEPAALVKYLPRPGGSPEDRDEEIITPQHDVDDLLDTINYVAMAVRMIRVGDRDGSWSYPKEVNW